MLDLAEGMEGVQFEAAARVNCFSRESSVGGANK
jgi:hypothetical protein